MCYNFATMKKSDLKTNTNEPVIITMSSKMPSDEQFIEAGKIFKRVWLPVFEKLAAE